MSSKKRATAEEEEDVVEGGEVAEVQVVGKKKKVWIATLTKDFFILHWSFSNSCSFYSIGTSKQNGLLRNFTLFFFHVAFKNNHTPFFRMIKMLRYRKMTSTRRRRRKRRSKDIVKVVRRTRWTLYQRQPKLPLRVCRSMESFWLQRRDGNCLIRQEGASVAIYFIPQV